MSYQQRKIQLHTKYEHQTKEDNLRDSVDMAVWIAVPICADCKVAMLPDGEGNFVCPDCEEYIESKEHTSSEDSGW